MDSYLSPEIVNSIGFAIDMNFENNEITFWGEFDSDNYTINEII